MTKTQALYEFFNGFGMKAYPKSAVPDETAFPWMTYENTVGNVGDQISIAVQLWYHTDSEAVPNAKVEEISEAIGLGGVVINHDGGIMWIKRGTPWSNPLDTGDNSVKARSLNIEIEFL